MASDYGYRREDVLKLTRRELFELMEARVARISGKQPMKYQASFTEEQKKKIEKLMAQRSSKPMRPRSS
jgi:hypothetical protein